MLLLALRVIFDELCDVDKSRCALPSAPLFTRSRPLAFLKRMLLLQRRSRLLQPRPAASLAGALMCHALLARVQTGWSESVNVSRFEPVKSANIWKSSRVAFL
jgi:hypothetical protein